MIAASYERCPKAMLRNELADASELVDDALVFREHGLPPRTGGLDDQPARWTEALVVVDQEIAALRNAAAPGAPNGG